MTVVVGDAVLSGSAWRDLDGVCRELLLVCGVVEARGVAEAEARELAAARRDELPSPLVETCRKLAAGEAR